MALAGVICSLMLYWKLTHPNTWKGEGYKITFEWAARELYWVEYEESGRILAFEAAWGVVEKRPHLSIQIEEKVYLPPDYATPLSEDEITKIQQRITDGLKHLKVDCSFMRLGHTSF
jgi:hypothetical protein